MSSTPATPVSTAALTLFDKYLVFVKAHEAIIIEIVAGVLLWFSTSAVLKRWDTYESNKAKAAQVSVSNDTQANAATAALIDQLRSQFANSERQLQEQTDAKIQQIKVAAPPEVAKDLGGTAVGNDIDLPLDAARGITAQLATIPGLTTDLADARAIGTDDQKLIDGLNKQLGDQTKACTAQVNALKVEKKKAWLSGFKYGAIVGFIGGVLLGRK